MSERSKIYDDAVWLQINWSKVWEGFSNNPSLYFQHFDSHRLQCPECQRRDLMATTTNTASHTVADIPDTELLARAVKSARSLERLCKPVPRWVAVKDVFLLGSTYAHQLCRRFGLDPDEMVTR